MLADLVADWEIPPFLRLCLAVLGENVFDELGAQRVERLVRFFVQINVQVSGNRIFAGIGRLSGRTVALCPIKCSQWDRADAFRLVAEAGIADCEFIVSNVPNDLCRTGLLLPDSLYLPLYKTVVLKNS